MRARRRLHCSPLRRYTPAVAYASASDEYLVVWKSFVQGNIANDIEGQALFSSGVLDGSNFLVAQGTWSESHDQPDLAVLFATHHFGPDFTALVDAVLQLTNARNLIGCAGEGVIGPPASGCARHAPAPLRRHARSRHRRDARRPCLGRS